MGFRLEKYSENYCNLVVDFSFTTNSSYFVATDSIDEAIKYFNLRLDESVMRLKYLDPADELVENLGITNETADEFQEQLDLVTTAMTDEQVLQCTLLLSEWKSGKDYYVGDRIRYIGIPYKCLTQHTSTAEWNPADAPSLWAKMLVDPELPEGVYPQWEQPDSTNGYSTGDRVTHNGIIYESTMDNNVWEPGTVGTESLWIIVEE